MPSCARNKNPEIRDEASGVDGRAGRLASEGEGVADDFLPELGEDLSQVSQVRIQALDDIEGSKRNLEGLSPGRRDLGSQPLRGELLRAHPERRCERLQLLYLRPEG